MLRERQGRWERRWELWGLWVLVFAVEISWILAFLSLRGASAFGSEYPRPSASIRPQEQAAGQTVSAPAVVQPGTRATVQVAEDAADPASSDSDAGLEPPADDPQHVAVATSEQDPIVSAETQPYGVTESSGAIEDAGVIEGTEPVSGEVLGDDGIPGDPEEAETARKVSLSYFGIFYGPGFDDPGPYQPKLGGGQDRNRPVQLKSFMTLGYQANEEIGVAGTAYWTYQPGLSQKFLIQDPFLRVSHNALMNTENFNWYGDFRVHFGVSDLSRSSDLLTSLQTFHAFTWVPGTGALAVSLYGSIRYNVFGNQGVGSDVEVYLAPYAQYDLSESLALTLMYELGASHEYGTRATHFVSDGADFEPGVLWQITPSLAVNPYLNLYPADGFALDTASFGVTLGWKLL